MTDQILLNSARRLPPLSYSADERKIFAATFTIGWSVVGFGVAGVVILALWSYGIVPSPSTAGTPVFSAVFGADLLVGAAAADAGALFGFIFGIPRTLDPASRAALA
jgi:hypothetical protein